jgi:tRNA G18 (ribose-2'-O)-methylase SpoU
MPRVPIDDLADPRIAMYRQLKATNATRSAGQFVVEGEKLFDRLLASRFPLASVLTTDRLAPRIAPRVPHDVQHYVVPDSLVGALVGFNFHRGVLACGCRRLWPGPDLLARAAGRRVRFVVCPRLDNPENLGAIVRIADVFGVNAVLAGDCPDPLSRRVLRVSMGSALRVPVFVVDDLATAINRLRDDLGFVTIATVLDPTAEPIETFRPPERLALMFGCEGYGLDPQWLAHCERRLTIAMRPGAESLNVAIAAGIILYHLTRADWTR